MKPVFQIFSPQAVNRILEEAYQLLADTGVRISDPEACSLLEDGRRESGQRGSLQIPRGLIQIARFPRFGEGISIFTIAAENRPCTFPPVTISTLTPAPAQ